MAKSPATVFEFLKLPGEIRDMAYSYCLPRDVDFTLHWNRTQKRLRRLQPTAMDGRDASVLRTCKQIQGEAYQKLIKNNRFTADNFTTLWKFLRQLSPIRIHDVKHLEFTWTVHYKTTTRCQFETSARLLPQCTSLRTLKIVFMPRYDTMRLYDMTADAQGNLVNLILKPGPDLRKIPGVSTILALRGIEHLELRLHRPLGEESEAVVNTLIDHCQPIIRTGGLFEVIAYGLDGRVERQIIPSHGAYDKAWLGKCLDT